MSHIKDMIKWSILMFVAALLIYFVFPKYKFMGPNDFAVFRCNTVTGGVMAWDMDAKMWVTPSRKTIGNYLPFKID